MTLGYFVFVYYFLMISKRWWFIFLQAMSEKTENKTTRNFRTFLLIFLVFFFFFFCIFSFSAQSRVCSANHNAQKTCLFSLLFTPGNQKKEILRVREGKYLGTLVLEELFTCWQVCYYVILLELLVRQLASQLYYTEPR